MHLIFYNSYGISKLNMANPVHLLMIFLFLTVSTVSSRATQNPDHLKAHLIAEVQSVQPGGSFSVGIHIELDEGWHTYWLNPGDSGLPIAIKWMLPSGFIAGDIQWPYPGRFGADFVANFGYEGEVLLITEIQASSTAKTGETLTIEADVEWLVCKEECLSGRTRLSLSLPIQEEEPAPNLSCAAKFAESRKKLPQTSSNWAVRAAIEKNHIFLHIASPAWFKNEMKDIQFFPEQLKLIDYSAQQLFDQTENGYTIKAKLSALAQKIPPKLLGVLVSDKSWFRDSDNRAIRIIVPLSQNNKKDVKNKKEVSR
jgi:thiol:disulfide interchange protein DsbD